MLHLSAYLLGVVVDNGFASHKANTRYLLAENGMEQLTESTGPPKKPKCVSGRLPGCDQKLELTLDES